jgi:hypothetical protein
LDLPVINNFDKDMYPQQLINMNTKFPKSVNLLETQRNLLKPTSGNDGNILLHLINMFWYSKISVSFIMYQDLSID